MRNSINGLEEKLRNSPRTQIKIQIENIGVGLREIQESQYLSNRMTGKMRQKSPTKTFIKISQD